MKRQVTSSGAESLRSGKETLPLAAELHRSHGTIPLGKTVPNGILSKQENGVSEVKKTQEGGGKNSKKDPDEHAPLSILRKIGFLMSFSVVVLYFAVFLYLIPCRNVGCRLRELWVHNLKNSHLTSDMKYLQNDDTEKLVLFGFSNDGNASYEREWQFGALNAQTGRLLWEHTLTFEARYFKCHLTDFTKCLVVGHNDIAYFNVSNGFVFWQRRLFPDVFTDSVQPEFLLTANVSRVVYAVDRNENGVFLNALESDTGFKMASAAIPCRSPPTSLQRADDAGNLILLCREDTVAGVWWIPAAAFSVENKDNVNEKEIILLFQLKYASATVKVFPLTPEDHLILTKSSALLSSTNSTHASWVSNFGNLTAIDAVVGHFSTETDDEFAVLLEDSIGNSEVRVFKLSNGASVSSASIPGPGSTSLLPVSAENASSESILVRTESGNISMSRDHEMTPMDQWHYLDNSNAHLRDISYHVVTFDGVASVSRILELKATNSLATVAPSQAGNNLLVSQEEVDGGLTIRQYELNYRTTSVCSS